METYKPLPEMLTIKESPINGLGLFARERIIMGTNLGMSHRILETGQMLRTPLGGFYNHSDLPNCMKVEEGHAYYLVTIKNIEPGEELTVDYTFYKVGKSKVHCPHFETALNKWLGNNGTEENEDAFQDGWEHGMVNENRGPNTAPDYPYDWEAGFKAAREFIKGQQQ